LFGPKFEEREIFCVSTLALRIFLHLWSD
jgi:hypothetical protein